jgi:hypothetical protein
MLEFNVGSVATRCRICEDSRPLPLRFAADVPSRSIDAAGPPTGALHGHHHGRCCACGTLVSRSSVGPCPLCGGETVADATATALAVDGWLPFLIDEHTARATLTAELRRLRIAATPVRFVGVHIPWLIYDCELFATYEGRRGEWVGEGNSRRLVWCDVSGTIDRRFENRRRSASRSVVGDLAERLDPWDWAFVEPPSAAITDAVCERCEITREHVASRAMGDFATEVADEVRYDIGGDAQEVVSVEARRSAERFRHILLPVWFGTLGDGHTRVAVNGRTGEVTVTGRDGREAEESEMEPATGSKRRGLVGVAIGVVVLLVMIAWALR